jgi:3-hydroxyisobutyrate dehydrogenase-like beta-hydroxyacid dehydrogenase
MSDITAKPVIGFIGVGFMGHGMAKNILKGGYELWIKGNRNRTPVDSLLSMGAKEAMSAREIAGKCDILHICLPNSAMVEAIVRGDDGILAGAKPGLIVIDTTTADPGSTKVLAEEMDAKGVVMVDAPLGRTNVEAEAGTLDAMVGCDENVFQTVLPVMECWAANINHVGPVGSGHKMKLLMNFISMGYGALYSEAVVVGAKVGISPQKVRQVIGSSRLSNGFFETFMRYVVDRDKNAQKFTIENASKDVRYLNNMANNADTVNVMASAVLQYYTHAKATGNGSQFIPMVSDHVAALSGIDLAEEVKKGEKGGS